MCNTCNSNRSDSEACNSGSDVDDCGSTGSYNKNLPSSSLVGSDSGVHVTMSTIKTQLRHLNARSWIIIYKCMSYYLF